MAVAPPKPQCRPPHRYPPARCSCLHTSKPPKRPDPAIYSQEEQLALGVAPTWNPDDITTNQRRPWTLLPESSVTVRNLSAEASAINTLVNFFTSPFGIGTQRTLLSSVTVNLSPNQVLELKFAMSQALLAGDPKIGAHVVIDHPDDAKRINNRGSQTVFGVFTTDVGRTLQFEFPVLNNVNAARQISLAVLANDLGAFVQPAVHNFAPFEQILVTLHAQVPPALHGSPGAEVRRDITVIGWAPGGVLVDGLTFVVRIDD